jgi:hypothetical protein
MGGTGQASARAWPSTMSAVSAPSLPTAALKPCATPRISVGNSSEACRRSGAEGGVG